MSDTYPQVSVVLSVLNGAECIEKTVNSILTQTFASFELVVIDDGSTDGTWHSLEKLIHDDRRIRIYRNEKNQGLIFSLNRALNLARGEYIARIDCGDVARADRLQVQWQILNDFPSVVLVGSQAEWMDGHGEPIFKTSFPHADADIRRVLKCGDNIVLHPTVMFRNLPHLRYDDNAIYAEDYALWLKLLSKGEFVISEHFLTKIEFDPKGVTFSRRIAQTKSVNKIQNAYNRFLRGADFVVDVGGLELTFFEKKQEELFCFFSTHASACLLNRNLTGYYFFKFMSALSVPTFVIALLKRRACRVGWAIKALASG